MSHTTVFIYVYKIFVLTISNHDNVHLPLYNRLDPNKCYFKDRGALSLSPCLDVPVNTNYDISQSL
jgi:hypothetical protein